ncbi:MAG: GntR family transcriptional regulator [bacterium]|nr:GntR family transcriptional regulator [bacterium]
MSTVDEVETLVTGAMLRGELEPGAWLRQDELARRFGVSKIPVREALQRLAAFGLLRFEANRGAVIPRLTADDAEEIYALRRSIEPQLLKRALPKLSIVDLAEAELALRSGDLVPTEANWSFHRALYQSSGWDRGLRIVELLHAAVAPYVILYTEGLGSAPRSDAEHADILDACRHSDPNAVTMLLRHLDGASNALERFLRDHPSSS